MLFPRIVAIVTGLALVVAAAGCGGGSAGAVTAPAPVPSTAVAAGWVVPSAPTPAASPAPSTQPTGSATVAPGPAATPSASAASAAHEPVILIPGMTSPASEMATMKAEFESAGWPAARVFTWTDSTDMEGDLAVAAHELNAEVGAVLAQTGAQHVVLVTWSAAALAARHEL